MSDTLGLADHVAATTGVVTCPLSEGGAHRDLGTASHDRCMGR